jgi:hypothetical protein
MGIYGRDKEESNFSYNATYKCNLVVEFGSVD